jgi:hypothetical protein
VRTTALIILIGLLSGCTVLMIPGVALHNPGQWRCAVAGPCATCGNTSDAIAMIAVGTNLSAVEPGQVVTLCPMQEDRDAPPDHDDPAPAVGDNARQHAAHQGKSSDPRHAFGPLDTGAGAWRSRAVLAYSPAAEPQRASQGAGEPGVPDGTAGQFTVSP